MADRDMRRICRGLLKAVELQPPLDPSLLAARLGALRGRPIRLLPRAAEGLGSFACVLPTETEDLLVYQAATSLADQRHLFYHECGHIYLNHLQDSLSTPRALICGFDPESGDPLKPRNVYDSRREWDAEAFALVLSEWDATMVGASQYIGEKDPIVARLNQAFGDLRGLP